MSEDGKSRAVVEQGTIDDIPEPKIIARERDPNPSPRNVPFPKGLIVSPMDGVTVTTDTK